MILPTAEQNHPRRSWRIQAQRSMHRLLDPVLSFPNRLRAAKKFSTLPDGAYQIPVPVPYVAQFASPELIRHYIHDKLHGMDDPNWPLFGTPDADTYTFWAHRDCAIACIKMALDAFATSTSQTMWQLTESGIALGGYVTHDESGHFIDRGWMYPALVKLAENNGLTVRGMAYASVLDLCVAIKEGWIIAAAVTPDLGERGRLRRYDGHFVTVYGFTWQGGRCTKLLLHNPSGRYPELQAAALIPARRFGAAFAHRFIAFRPAAEIT